MKIKPFTIEKAIAIILFFIIIFSNIHLIGTAQTTQENNKLSYIIEFNLPCIIEIKNQIQTNTEKPTNLKQTLQEKLDTHLQKIKQQHQKLKEIIKKHQPENNKIREFFNVINAVSIKINSNTKRILEKLPIVKKIYPNKKVTPLLDQSVPIIKADKAWKLNSPKNIPVTGKKVTIALIDTGVNYTHPDLNSSYAGGYDLYNNDQDPMDDNGHGTHCTGILVSDGKNSFFQGVAPNASLYAYKALGQNGGGNISTMIAAIERAIDPNQDGDLSDHMDVISLSVGVEGKEGDPDDPLCKALDRAVEAGSVVVTAAGNDGPDARTIVTPGCTRKAITVGASDKQNSIYYGSSRGPSKIGTIKPDVVAPGVSITSTWVNGEYKTLTGTSMAAPHVAGVVALIKQKHPNWTPKEIKTAIRFTAKDIGASIISQGLGRVNAFRAVNLTTPPPIASLYSTGENYSGNIKIKGTATSRDFLNYTLYYKHLGNSTNIDSFQHSEEWKKLYESETKIVNDTLYNWQKSSLSPGSYLIKLVTRDKSNRASGDLRIIHLNSTSNINIPKDVNEGEKFKVSLEEGGIIIFTSPFRIPQIKFGNTATFEAYYIFRSETKTIKSNLYILSFFNSEKIRKKTIRIHNT